jgi:hypothetical protein
VRRGPVVVAAAILAVGLALASPCRADLVISAPDITATAGSSGSFLVIITDTGPMSYSVKSDSFQLALTAGQTDVTFTSATTSPSNYIYTNSVANVFSGGSIDSKYPGSSFPTTASFIAADSAVSTATILNPGGVLALGLISYTVSASATPGSVIALGFGGPGNPNNSLSDQSSQPVPFTTMDGSITITVVPEPASLSLLLSALAIGAVGRWLRRRETRSCF